MTRRVLLVSSLSSRDERSIGGVTALNETIKSFLTNRVPVIHIQARKFWFKGAQYLEAPFVIFQIIFKSLKVDVISIHASKDMHLSLGVIVCWVLKMVLKKRVVYHVFGGRFPIVYEGYPSFVKWVICNTIFKSDELFLETKRSVKYFKEVFDKGNFSWLPNAREKSKETVSTIFEKKFVFISRVTKDKGVSELISVFNSLPKEYSLDIYGPMDESFEFDKKGYKGVLAQGCVTKFLLNYDVLVLPTYYSGEGYPGIIIEALSTGVPVITTDWNCLDELIENGVNGELVGVKDKQQLKEAVLKFNESNYSSYVSNALESFKQFDVELVFSKLLSAYNYE